MRRPSSWDPIREHLRLVRPREMDFIISKLDSKMAVFIVRVSYAFMGFFYFGPTSRVIFKVSLNLDRPRLLSNFNFLCKLLILYVF